jgi:nucleotidyltransferase/DNA polymerase involved in DNA repair
MIVIGHIDSDCFYVSAERVRFPSLRGIPVGVLGNQGACVIAKSYELKAAGVKTGMPIWDARKLCPEAVFVKRDFRWYEVLSRKMLDVLADVSPLVEYYSIDEMFFDASELPRVFGGSMQQATETLQQRMKDEVGVPVSIGIARSKTMAKLGSDTAKSFGVRVLHDLTDAARRAFLSAIPVGELCGIGKKSEQKLASHGITNCQEFIQAKSSFIQKLLTIKGEALWWELQGESVDKIVTARPPHKAISRGGSLGGKTADGPQQHAWAVRNVERLIEAMDYHGVFARKFVLLLERPNDYGWAGQTILAEPTNAFKLLCAVFREMLDRSDSRDKAISHMHLIAEKLTYRESLQRTLFETRYESNGKPISDSPVDRLAELKQQINARIGRFAVRSGETLHLPDVYDDETNDYDICDVQGKMCF